MQQDLNKNFLNLKILAQKNLFVPVKKYKS